MIPSLEGWPTKAKEASSAYEVRRTPLDSNPVFQCLGFSVLNSKSVFSISSQVLKIVTQKFLFLDMSFLLEVISRSQFPQNTLKNCSGEGVRA